jgi:hypothetical protein
MRQLLLDRARPGQRGHAATYHDAMHEEREADRERAHIARNKQKHCAQSVPSSRVNGGAAMDTHANANGPCGAEIKASSSAISRDTRRAFSAQDGGQH